MHDTPVGRAPANKPTASDRVTTAAIALRALESAMPDRSRSGVTGAARDYGRAMLHASHSQPPIITAPPAGVTGPSHFGPPSANP